MIEACGRIEKVQVLRDVDFVTEYAVANLLDNITTVVLKVASCAPSKVDHYLN